MLVWSHCAHTGPSITFLLRQVQDHPGRMPPHHEVNKEPSVRVWRGTGEGESQPQSSSRPRLLLTGKHFLLDKKKRHIRPTGRQRAGYESHAFSLQT